MVPSLIVHGGAGPVEPARLPICVAGCERAAAAGWAVLGAGGSALDAVEAAVRTLEDDPQFNAGYGSVLNRDGVVEVDGAVMEGSLRAGAVGAVPWLRHPVSVARRLLELDHHVLLVGAGAAEFAAGCGLAPESGATMISERSRGRWEAERAGRLAPSATGDTVGACAIDGQGRLAAATSTGGISGKHPGRVGDSPILGAGTWADDRAGAASTTGHGESILRVVMAKLAVDRLRAGEGAMAAAAAAVAELQARTGDGRGRGQGGIVLLDRAGEVGYARNTTTMPWAAIRGGLASHGA